MDHKRGTRELILQSWGQNNPRAAVWLSKMQNSSPCLTQEAQAVEIRPLRAGHSQKFEPLPFSDAKHLIESFRYRQLDVDCAAAGMCPKNNTTYSFVPRAFRQRMCSWLQRACALHESRRATPVFTRKKDSTSLLCCGKWLT